jgi:glycosyltransferase involved in cell wall biosynthesis
MHFLFTCADNQITTRNHRGYAIHIRELLDALARQQVVVTPFIAGDAQPPRETTADSVGIKTVLKNSLLKPLIYHLRDRLKLARSKKFATTVARQISRPPDVIYERYEGTSALGIGLARKFSVPLVLEINAPFWQDARYYNQHRTRLAERVDRQILRQAHAIVVVTEMLKKYLVEMGISGGKIRVIPNGVNVAAFAAPKTISVSDRLPQLENRTIVGYVGSFSKWHRLDYLVEAATRLTTPSIHFLLVGNGADRARIQSLVQQRQLEEKFTFTGEIPYSKIPAYLHRFDLAVLPDTEAYCSPIKIFEYLAAGKPVVVPDLPTLRQIITPGHTGILFKQNDISDLAAALQFLISNPARRREIGENGLNLVRTRFSWENTATQIIKLINEISN